MFKLEKTIKNYLKSFLYFIIPFLGLLFITSIFYYFDILSNQVIRYFKIIIVILSSLLGGYSIGKKSTNKGYLSGLKLSAIIVSLFLIINIILKGFKWYHLVYYIIIMIVTIIGSMIGINRKK